MALVDASIAPRVLSASRHTNLLSLAQDPCPPLAELSAPEMRLGGLRVDPCAHAANACVLDQEVGTS